MEIGKSIAFAALGCCLAGSDQAAASDINYTGPLLTPNANILPKGMVSVEPYLVYSSSRHYYDDNGRKQSQSPRTQWQTLLPMAIGISDRFGMQAVLGAAHTQTGGRRSAGMRVNDTSLRAQFLLLRPSADGHSPALSLSAIHRFPTGRHDRLDDNPLNGSGSGAHSDRLDLLIQQSITMPSGRPLRWRGRLLYDFAPGSVNVSGRSVYGTPAGFRGKAYPGHAWTVAGSAEYSVDAHWVMVMELSYQRSSASRVLGGVTDATGVTPYQSLPSPGYNLSIAPAIEYNINSRLGIIGGVHMSVAGRNSSAFVAPQIAVNMLF